MEQKIKFRITNLDLDWSKGTQPLSLSKCHMTGIRAGTVRMRICSCKTFVTSRPQSLSFHSPILTVKIKIIRGPPNYLSMIQALIPRKKNRLERALAPIIFTQKLPFACSPKYSQAIQFWLCALPSVL